MPKVLKRCRRHHMHHDTVPAMSVAPLLPTIRKVSFEDNFPNASPEDDENNTTAPTTTPQNHMLPEEMKPLRLSNSTLSRIKSSISLVDLANQSGDFNSIADVPQDAIISAPVSPIASPLPTPVRDVSTTSQSPSGSPYGYFIDMPQSFDLTRDSLPQHTRGSSCNCCTACRQRRAGPYGDYRTLKLEQRSYQQQQQQQQQQQLTLDRKWNKDLASHNRNHFTIMPFSLSPRRSREPTERLIGALNRLHVDS